LLDNNKCS